jgi:hypothetical protein
MIRSTLLTMAKSPEVAVHIAMVHASTSKQARAIKLAITEQYHRHTHRNHPPCRASVRCFCWQCRYEDI